MTEMTRPAPSGWSLPDPDNQAEFYADVPLKRAMAWLIDSLLIAAITLVIVPFTAFTALFFLPALWVVIGLVYRVVSLTRSSATPGMRVMAIEFRNHRDEKFGLGEAVLHTLLYSVAVSMVLPQIISIVLMLTTARAQGLPDLLLGTVALNRAR